MLEETHSTIAQCADCHRVYAAYYTNSTLKTPSGDDCPNCGSSELSDVQDSGL